MVYIVALASMLLGVLVGLLIIQDYAGRGIGLCGNHQEEFQLKAEFRNGRLVVSITNLGSSEVEVQMVFLEGRDYIDFEAPINVPVKPGDTVEIRTEIMQPDGGTCTVRVKLSNGRTLDCKIAAR
ncbi:MAG: hypothetical protein QXJ19_03255 [Candidatus Bathyarchaeia archaeon]|nr:hypothetical protein [Candidatus Bathyarchaeota archaeon]